MSLQPKKPAPLDWDPSMTQTAEGETSRFVWAIAHEPQGDQTTWCWAVCLRNALTSIGRYMTKEEIRDKCFQQKKLPLVPLAADERIPPPTDVEDLWRLFGYVPAEMPSRDEKLLFKDLAREIAT